MRWSARLLGVLALVALVVGALAYLRLIPKHSSPPDRASVNHGEAGTAVGGKVGFSVDVDSVQRGVDMSGSTLVVVTVTFHNSSGAQQRADPLDFSLQTGDKARGPVFVAGTDCAQWPRTDLYPAHASGQAPRDPGGGRAGQSFGPSTVCFADPGPGSLSLVWDPDVSAPFLDSPTVIPLG